MPNYQETQELFNQTVERVKDKELISGYVYLDKGVFEFIICHHEDDWFYLVDAFDGFINWSHPVGYGFRIWNNCHHTGSSEEEFQARLNKISETLDIELPISDRNGIRPDTYDYHFFSVPRDRVIEYCENLKK